MHLAERVLRKIDGVLDRTHRDFWSAIVLAADTEMATEATEVAERIAVKKWKMDEDHAKRLVARQIRLMKG